VLNEVLKLGAKEINTKLFEAGYQEATTKVSEKAIETLKKLKQP
jgi:hypothetical protein